MTSSSSLETIRLREGEIGALGLRFNDLDSQSRDGEQSMRQHPALPARATRVFVCDGDRAPSTQTCVLHSSGTNTSGHAEATVLLQSNHGPQRGFPVFAPAPCLSRWSLLLPLSQHHDHLMHRRGSSAARSGEDTHLISWNASGASRDILLVQDNTKHSSELAIVLADGGFMLQIMS